MRLSRGIAKKMGVALATLMLLSLSAPSVLAATGEENPANSNLGFLLAGSLLTWAGFFVYAFYISRKNSELRREVEELSQLLGKSKPES